MATNGRGVRTQRLVVPAHHVAVGSANRHELVKGEYDPGARQDTSGQGDELDAQGEKVMDVNDVGCYQAEKVGVSFEQQRAGRSVPPIIVFLT